MALLWKCKRKSIQDQEKNSNSQHPKRSFSNFVCNIALASWLFTLYKKETECNDLLWIIFSFKGKHVNLLVDYSISIKMLKSFSAVLFPCRGIFQQPRDASPLEVAFRGGVFCSTFQSTCNSTQNDLAKKSIVNALPVRAKAFDWYKIRAEFLGWNSAL